MTALSEQQASTSSPTLLPSRKAYLTTLSVVAFISGLGVATVVTIRRGRRMRLEELQAGTHTSSSAAGNRIARNASAHHSPVAESSGASQSPLALFKDMNRAAFGVKKNEQLPGSESPSAFVRNHRGKEAKTSVFDSLSDAPPPSALMCAPAKATSDRSQGRQSDRVEEEEQGEEGLLESPALLGAKAIAIATALVGAGAFLTWEVGRRVLKVQSVDELVDRLAEVVPSRSKEAHQLALDGQGGVGSADEPMSLDQALEALDEAARKGQAGTWVSILSRQLNAEREQDVEQRRERIRSQQGAVREKVLV